MDTKELVSTSVMIAGRSYSLKIEPSNEPVIKQVVKEVNEKINSFATTYIKKDKQDCLAMVLLTYAVDAKSNANSEGLPSDSGVEQQIQQIDEMLDQLLQPVKA